MSKLFSKLKKRPKRKVEDERVDLRTEQQLLRKRIKELENQLDELNNEEADAFKANDGSKIAILDHRIKAVEESIKKLKANYRDNVEAEKTYSETMKNDREGRCATRNSWLNALATILGGTLVGVGLKKAYISDEAGTLVNKKTLDWVKTLPIIRNFGRLK